MNKPKHILYGCELCFDCDPQKNTTCRKKYCGKIKPHLLYEEKELCFQTINAEYAKLDRHGNPIITRIVYGGGVFTREEF